MYKYVVSTSLYHIFCRPIGTLDVWWVREAIIDVQSGAY
jgi:hypothetical protein